MNMRQKRPVRTAALTLGIAFFLWTLNTWPLIVHIDEGIPYTHYRNEEAPARHMVPGDHLQLLYHFSLGADMVAGGTEPFYNPYEFNFDGDSTRREPGGYFFPFSVIFGLFNLLLSAAGAWNMTVLVSLWLTALFSWMLAGRLTSSRPARLLAVVAAVAFPMRWTSLMGGSPTGFAMAWLPLLWLAVTDMVQRGRLAAGAVAGLAVFLLCLGDTHSFFFGVLSMPLAALLILVFGYGTVEREGPSPARRLAASLPAAAGIALAYAYTRWTTLAPAGAAAEGGRSWREVGFFAPKVSGLFGFGTHGVDSHIYIGYVLIGALLAGGVATLAAGGGGRRRRLAGWLLLGTAFLGVVFLALGPNGPLGGAALKAARKIVPPYAMVRQSAKIFCLVPTLAVFGLAVGWESLRRLLSPRQVKLLAAACIIALVFEYRLLYRPGISLIDESQGAYGAVAADAAGRGELPRALAIPLWPGDSHLSSIYEHYAFRHRLRLVNGYRPFIPAGYVDNVFVPFESVNQGDILPRQAEELLSRGIRYIILHEDIFPEKVSPFPVGIALEKLLADRRLRFIERDGPVWAFELTRAGGNAGPPPTGPFFPAWHRSGASAVRSGDARVEQEGDGHRFLKLAGTGAACRFGTFSIGEYPRRHWLLRARGDGSLAVRFEKPSTGDSSAAAEGELSVQSPGWKWFALPLTDAAPFVRQDLLLELRNGTVEIDRLYFGAGPPAPPSIRGGTFWPASRFFRPGYTASPGGSVVLRQGFDPADTIFYGPLFPVSPGRYLITFLFESAADEGTPLGRFTAGSTGGGERTGAAVTAGTLTQLRYSHGSNLPLRLDFTFAGTADIEIMGVRIEPLP